MKDCSSVEASDWCFMKYSKPAFSPNCDRNFMFYIKYLSYSLLYFSAIVDSFRSRTAALSKSDQTRSTSLFNNVDSKLTAVPNEAFSSARVFIERLNSLKAEGKVTKWDSSLMEVRSATTKADLQFISRNSFSSLNYFEDLIEGAKRSQQQGSAEMPFIAVSAASFFFSALVVPILPVPDWLKNIAGLLFLLTPFMLIIVNLVAPGVYQTFQKRNSEANTEGLSDRILYHEAGHFLAGYLCGVPVISYDITGDRDAGTEIALDISDQGTLAENMQALKDRSGKLLVVSMAGMVSETLRFGDSKGGAEDLLFATEILRLLRVPMEEKEGSLRWAVMKALLLLRINRDALDRVAEYMKTSAPVTACIQAIEED